MPPAKGRESEAAVCVQPGSGMASAVAARMARSIAGDLVIVHLLGCTHECKTIAGSRSEPRPQVFLPRGSRFEFCRWLGLREGGINREVN